MPLKSGEEDRYVLLLNTALAMESALVDHLEKRAAQVKSARMRERLEQHRQETMRHREACRSLIQAVKGEPTPSKAVIQSPVVPGIVGKVLTALESEKADRLLLEGWADYAVEQYEAVLYSSMMVIARNLGHASHVSALEAIRDQERDMASFIASALPESIDEAFPPSAKVA